LTHGYRDECGTVNLFHLARRIWNPAFLPGNLAEIQLNTPLLRRTLQPPEFYPGKDETPRLRSLRENSFPPR
jgi:hypothetical protein